MAFNDPIQTVAPPNFTGVSQGTGPNRAFESLFGGIADTVQNVTTVRDKATQRAIEQDAQAGFEGVNEEFGLTPPSDMVNELDRVTSLEQARKQGKISETNYYGRLATLSKQLRSKYPRYESIVDQTIQSVTGTRPANAYRDALFSEINSIAQSASDQTKFRRQFEKENSGEIASIFPDDYFQNPDKYDFATVQSEVAKYKSRELSWDSEMKQMNLMKSRGEANTDQAKKLASQRASFIVEAQLNKAIGGNAVNFEQEMDNFVKNGMTDVEGITQSLATRSTTLRSELFNELNREFISKGLMTQEDANKTIEAAMFPLVEAQKAIVGGDYNMAGRMASVNKFIADQSLNNILKNSPEAVVGSGLTKLNDAVGAEYLNRKMDKFETLAQETVGRALSGTDPKIVENAVKSGDQKYARATVMTSIEVFKNPNLKGGDMTNLVDQFFGPQAVDFMSGDIVNTEDLEKMYTTLLDPKVTANIKTNGSEEDFQKYTDWALEKFRALPSIRAAAGNLNSAQGMFSELKLKYDPKTNRVSVESFGGFSMSGQRQTFQRVIGSFNKGLAVLDPIAKANGTTMEQMLPALVNDLVDMEKTPGKGFFSWMSEQLSMSAEAGEMPQNASVLEEETVDGGEIDFFDPDNSVFPEGVPVSRNDRKAYIIEGLQDRGLPLHVAEAFVMNFQDESGLNPGINEAKPLVPGSRGGYGLYQVTGPRRREYEAFAKRRGRNLDDIDTQLDNLMRELSTTERAAAEKILSSKTRGQAAVAIVKNFLRPHPTHQASRSRRYSQA